MSYRELHERANRLAMFLRNRSKIEPNTLIGIYVDRSIETIIAMLGVMKAGAGFVPIDPLYPTNRVKYMIGQCSSSLFITEKHLVKGLDLTDREAIYLDEIDSASKEFSSKSPPPLANSSMEDIAYVIYTSGTTGNPKGVMVPHRAVGSFLDGMIDRPGITCDDRILTNASISFDMMVYEIFLPLAVGAELVMTSREHAGDGDHLVHLLEKFRITTMIATPASWRIILSAGWQGSPGFKTVCGGEAFPRDLANELLLRSESVWNIYGPTETTVIMLVEQVKVGSDQVLLGFPTTGTELFIVTEKGLIAQSGAVGELFIGGPQVTLGYLNSPDLTAEKFVENTFQRQDKAPLLYRSGDMVRQRPDGNLEYHGRVDHQVKIRGFRVEIGEIEAAVARWSEVKFTHVVVREDHPGDKRIVAYVILKDRNGSLSVTTLKNNLRQFLPEYMVPHHFMVLDSFPMTTNGKVNDGDLPEAYTLRSTLSEPITLPRNSTEKALVEVFAGILQYDQIGIHDDLFGLGLNSLLAMRAICEFRSKAIRIFAAQIYQYQTVFSIFENIFSANNTTHEPSAPPLQSGPKRGSRDIAIIGMAGRFPFCDNINEFWKILCAGQEAINHMSIGEISSHIPDAIKSSPDYVPSRGYIDGIENFDAKFFAIPPVEAAMIDPQQRIFLEECWHALEDAGYAPSKFFGRIGVFAGMHRSTYFNEIIRFNPAAIDNFGDFNSMVAVEKDYVASRVAYRLDLSGPAVSVHTACSTSLVAIIQAVNALRCGQCEMALAGGVAVTVPQKSGHLYQEGNIQSKDGHTRAFAADATGTVFSDGAGVVVLKTLESARRDKDRIYAVIRGVGINNDGRAKSSFMAPSIAGQQAAIRYAIEDAQIDPHEISHVEAHGTGTIIGDPIETAALKAALTKNGEGAKVKISSIKGNFGHMVAAAGVSSVIKTALSLQTKLLPPSLYVDALNPDCGFDERFTVNKTLEQWSSEGDFIAGVSSFGVGGTNAHVIMERFEEQIVRQSPKCKFVLVPISARSKNSLAVLTASLSKNMVQRPAGWPRIDVAYTQQTGRQEFHERTFFVIDTMAPLDLASIKAATTVTNKISSQAVNPPICFVFPGQGSQYVGMGAAIYEAEPRFKENLDRILGHLLDRHGIDLHDLLTRPQLVSNPAAVKPTRLAQPAIFSVSLALAQTWQHLGITPTAVMGHSIGEFVAAVIAGIMTELDAIDFIALRAAITSELPVGAMLSVRQSAAVVSPQVPKGCKIAAINGPSQVVVAGPLEAIVGFSHQLATQGVLHTQLETSHAFHSQMMVPAIEPLEQKAAKLHLNPPKISFFSSVKGRTLSAQEATDPSYWGLHVVETVNFEAAVCAAHASGITQFIEVGPRGALTSMIKQNVKDAKSMVSMSPGGNPDLDYLTFLQSMGQLWQHGYRIQWQSLGLAEHARRVSLPLYPFDRQRYWLLP